MIRRVLISLLPELFEGLDLQAELVGALEVAPDPAPPEHGIVLVRFVLPAHHVPELIGGGIQSSYPDRFSIKGIKNNFDSSIKFLDELVFPLVGNEPTWRTIQTEDEMLDMQHAESLFYQTVIWEIRCGHLYSQMRTSGEEHMFWDKLRLLMKGREQPITVSDSHVYVLSDDRFLLGCDTILLFDRHHDCWRAERDDRKAQVWHCHTWARGWLNGDKNTRMIWGAPRLPGRGCVHGFV
jgi:hypothetical protein